MKQKFQLIHSFFWSLLTFLVLIAPIHGELLSPEMGTIIVTYQMDREEKCLDRIHFWLINGHKERTLYPKKNEFVSNSHSPKERIVVITHLPVGHYRIEFLIPNGDNKFEEVPPRDLILTAGCVIKIDQNIRHRLHALPFPNDSNELAFVVINRQNPFYPYPRTPYPYLIPGSSSTPTSRATFSLTSNQQSTWKLIRNRRIFYSGFGSVSNLSIPPGNNYWIRAEEIPGYRSHTSPKNPFNLYPGQILRFELYYQEESGPLNIEENGRKESEESERSEGSIEIVTDSSQALFSLANADGAVIASGKGYHHLFKDLNPGTYILNFSNEDPALFPSVSTQKISVRDEKEQIKIGYHKAGPEMKSPKSPQIPPQKSHEPLKKQVQKGGIQITSNLSEAQYTLEDSSSNSKPLAFKGKSTFIPLPSGGNFRLLFAAIPNYQTPEPVAITLKEGEKNIVEGTYIPQDAFVEVPAGPAIIGDPFSDDPQNERPAREVYIPAFAIAVYEVTNAQYANWLNQSLQAKKVVAGDPNHPGYLLNQEGKILCRTLEANRLSQLTAQKFGNGVQVSPIPGKENYPVIEVTWLGAQAFCQDKGYRLPTEAEWEKAAGTAMLPGSEKPKRYKFGFSQDTIDRSWANYRYQSPPPGAIQVLTTPVGFYNGINTLPLTVQDHTPLKTHNAKSPAGAYDMSGNVWEWVASGENGNAASSHIVKGGCYDSLPQGVRVSERLLLPLDYSDIYTGFRVAKDK